MPLVPSPHPSYRDGEPGRCEDVDELLLGGEQVEVRIQTSVEEQVGEFLILVFKLFVVIKVEARMAAMDVSTGKGWTGRG